jgi:ArsR family transcriptional regulator
MNARAKGIVPTEVFESAAEVMKAIAHPIRLRILEILDLMGEANVTTLSEKTGASQPAVSQQLSRMRGGGVLGTRREGTSVFYRVERPEVLGMLDCIRKTCKPRRGRGGPS